MGWTEIFEKDDRSDKIKILFYLSRNYQYVIVKDGKMKLEYSYNDFMSLLKNSKLVHGVSSSKIIERFEEFKKHNMSIFYTSGLVPRRTLSNKN